MSIRLFSALCAGFLNAALPAQAHFVWIESEAVAGDQVMVTAGFGEPGGFDADLAGNIKQTTYAAVDQEGGRKPIELQRHEAKGGYSTVLPTGSATAIVGDCVYGVVAKGGEPFLLRYNARHNLTAAADWSTAATPGMRAEVVAEKLANGVKLTVYVNGKPAGVTDLKAFAPGQETVDLKTDATGTVLWPITAAGSYAVYARVSTNDAGTHDGKDYKSVRDYATLTFRLDKGN